MNALILAAGFGSRLMPLTQSCPKCMVNFKGKKIIDYELEALRQAGVEKISVVGGYLFDVLKSYLVAQGVRDIFCNSDFRITNMVSTFFVAKDFLLECIRTKTDLIVSYADIIYHQGIVKKLLETRGDFCIVVDLDWEKMWKKRFDDPLSDAESLKIIDGRIKELGKKADCLSKIDGQYIGLFKFSYAFLEKVLEVYSALDREANYDGQSFSQMYMTSFLQCLIDRFDNAIPVMIHGGWGEIDSCRDLEVLENEKNFS